MQQNGRVKPAVKATRIWREVRSCLLSVSVMWCDFTVAMPGTLPGKCGDDNLTAHTVPTAARPDR